MTVTLKAGSRFKSSACETQVMVIKVNAGDYDLRCGGSPMVGATATDVIQAGLDPAFAGGTMIGKRYITPNESVELLCTKAGRGTLALGGVPLQTKEAKQLPSSD